MKNIQKLITKTDSQKAIRELRQHLECKICYNDMIGNILQCQNGHLICQACAKSCNTCPYCKNAGVFTRNLAMENLLQNHTVRCPHKECSIACKRQKMNEHIKICKQRPMMCPCCNQSIWCDNSSILDHLKVHHKCKQMQAKETKKHTFALTLCFALPKEQYKKCLTWVPHIIEANDKNFFFHVKANEETFKVNVYEIRTRGEESQASCKLTHTCFKTNSKTIVQIRPMPNVSTCKENVENTHFVLCKSSTYFNNEQYILQIGLEFDNLVSDEMSKTCEAGAVMS